MPSKIDVEIRVGPYHPYYKVSNLKRRDGSALGTVSSVKAKLLDADRATVPDSEATLSENGNGDYDGTSSTAVELEAGKRYQAWFQVTMQDGTVDTLRSIYKEPAWH